MLAADLDPLERGPTVWTGEAPGHLPDSRRVGHASDSQLGRPRCGWIGKAPLAGRVKVIPDDGSKESSLSLAEARPVSVESGRDLELHASGFERSVEVLEQRVGPVDHGDTAGSHVLIDLALHGLPAIGPEPSLIRRNGQNLPELDAAIVLLHDLDLRARFVQMQPAPKVSRQCNRTSRLDGDEMRFHVMQYSSNAASWNQPGGAHLSLACAYPVASGDHKM